jgi:penicillin-binding protein-related factor A (putative recombinase)
MEVQAVLVDKKYFTKKDAMAWVKKRFLPIKPVHVTNDNYRYRIREPVLFNKKSFRTKEITKGVKIIVGKLKK